MRSFRVAAKYQSRMASESGPCKLLVSNLDFAVSESDLNELFREDFAKFKLQSLMLHHDSRGKSLGTAELSFYRRSDAIGAMKYFNGILFHDRLIGIEVVGSLEESSKALSSTTLSEGRSSLEVSMGLRLGKLEVECGDVMVGLRGVKERCEVLQDAVLEDRKAGQGVGEGLQTLEDRLARAEARLDKFLLQKAQQDEESKQLKINLVKSDNKNKLEVDEIMNNFEVMQVDAENANKSLNIKIGKLEDLHRQMQCDFLKVVEHCEEFEKDLKVVKNKNTKLCAKIEMLEAERVILLGENKEFSSDRGDVSTGSTTRVGAGEQISLAKGTSASSNTDRQVGGVIGCKVFQPRAPSTLPPHPPTSSGPSAPMAPTAPWFVPGQQLQDYSQNQNPGQQLKNYSQLNNPGLQLQDYSQNQNPFLYQNHNPLWVPGSQ